MSRNFDFVIKNARYGVSDMRKYVKIVFTAFQKPQFVHLLTEQPWFALPTETCSCLHVSTLLILNLQRYSTWIFFKSQNPRKRTTLTVYTRHADTADALIALIITTTVCTNTAYEK